MKKFPKWLVVLIIFAVCVIALFSCYKNTYNSLVYMEENVSGQWAEVQNQYQRRMDLIPNLVSTVKGYASHESEVFKQVSDARSKAGGQINISDEVLSNPEAFERYQQVQDQLEGTENRITVARGRYNDAAKQYNSKIRSFPTNLIANMSGFEKKIYFSASAEAQSAPKVEF